MFSAIFIAALFAYYFFDWLPRKMESLGGRWAAMRANNTFDHMLGFMQIASMTTILCSLALVLIDWTSAMFR